MAEPGPATRPDGGGPIPYGRQDVTDADVAAVAEVLRSDYLTQGPAVAAFEAAFAEYVDAPHAVAVANGTAALHLCALPFGSRRTTRGWWSIRSARATAGARWSAGSP